MAGRLDLAYRRRGGQPPAGSSELASPSLSYRWGQWGRETPTNQGEKKPKKNLQARCGLIIGSWCSVDIFWRFIAYYWRAVLRYPARCNLTARRAGRLY